MAFLVCCKLGKEISDCEATDENLVVGEKSSAYGAEELYEEEEELDGGQEGAGTRAAGNPKRATRDYIALLNEMWADSSNHIDIYTVKHGQIIINAEITGNFTVKPLKTFDDPKGAFILIEANFTPPASTMKS